MRKILIPGMLALLFAFWAAGCEQEGPMEKTGENVDEAAETAGDKMDQAAEKMGEAAERAGDKMEDATQ